MTFRALLPLLMASACGADGSPLPTSQAGPADLTISTLVGTTPATFTVAGLPPGTTAYLFRGSSEVTDGYCPGAIAPECLDLQANPSLMFSMTADANGEASRNVPIPDLPSLSLAWQMAWFDGGALDKSNVVSNQLHAATSDLDSDGLTAIEEVAAGTDPGVLDSDAGGASDGAEVTAGTDPLDGLDDPPTWEADVLPLSELRCGTGCHWRGNNSAASFNHQVYAQWFEVSGQLPSMDRIEPFDPDLSYTWHKLNNTHRDVGGTGRMMPRSGALVAGELEVFEDWILAGAPRR